MTTPTIGYVPPGCCCDDAFRVDLLCASPEDGGLEDVGYEDWVITD